MDTDRDRVWPAACVVGRLTKHQELQSSRLVGHVPPLFAVESDSGAERVSYGPTGSLGGAGGRLTHRAAPSAGVASPTIRFNN
ncbi:hypothetical protein MHM582_1011 [Microbacterium sp. HM58-2]|nr:hypothetical protein MHM582_1011 [Microbacterium sp. HM58-2]